MVFYDLNIETSGDRELLKSVDGEEKDMTLQELLDLGFTQEQANSVFALNGRDVTALRGQIATLTQENTDLQSVSSELKTLKQQSMTAEQLQQKAIDDANAEKAKYTKLTLSVKARENLIKGGLAPDEIDDDLLDLMISDTEENTEKRCKSYTERIASKLEKKESELKEALLKATKDPTKPGGSGATDELSDAVKKAKEMAPSIGTAQVDLSSFE